jgi:methylmalonyl-CoA mutase N-terminal domain/subunit
MTNQMADEIKEELKTIARLGGAVKCIQLGYQVEQIESNAFDIAQKIEKGTKKIIGLNHGTLDLRNNPEVFVTHSSNKKQALANLGSKSERNVTEVKKSLGVLRNLLLANLDLLPQMKQCILAGATIGEICRELSDVWGTEKNTFDFYYKVSESSHDNWYLDSSFK